MSVYRQHQYAESATIADELESFLHVLVFYCLLLMKSNMLYHSRFTQYYFRHISGTQNVLVILDILVSLLIQLR